MMPHCLNVTDMDRAVAFYCGLLGMTVQADRSGQRPGRRNLFLGYGPEAEASLLELCSEADGRRYDKGNAYQHLAIAVDDVVKVCANLAAADIEIVRPAKTAMSGAQIAMVRDPDGYLLELIQPAP